jgi:hypothetical protein
VRVGQLGGDVELELRAEVNLLVTNLDQQLIVTPSTSDRIQPTVGISSNSRPALLPSANVWKASEHVSLSAALQQLFTRQPAGAGRSESSLLYLLSMLQQQLVWSMPS